MFLRASLVPVTAAFVLLLVAVILANEVLVYVAFGLAGVSILLVALGLFAPDIWRSPGTVASQRPAGSTPQPVVEATRQPSLPAQSTPWSAPPPAAPPQTRWHYPTTTPGPVPAAPRDPGDNGGITLDTGADPATKNESVVDSEDTTSPAGAAGDDVDAPETSAAAPAADPTPIPDDADTSDDASESRPTDLDDAEPTASTALPDSVGSEHSAHSADGTGGTEDAAVDNTDIDDISDGTVDSAVDNTVDDTVGDTIGDAAAAPSPEVHQVTDPALTPPSDHTEPADAPEDSDEPEQTPDGAIASRSEWDPEIFAAATGDHTHLDREPPTGPDVPEPSVDDDGTTFDVTPDAPEPEAESDAEGDTTADADDDPTADPDPADRDTSGATTS